MIKVRINRNGQEEIFDIIRKKFVVATPEEKIRQTYIHYLIEQLHIPPINIIVERAITYNALRKRFDIMVYKQCVCKIIVECKAANVDIDEQTFFQAAIYNKKLKAEYIVLFNGKIEKIFKRIDDKYQFCSHLPLFEDL